METFENYHAHLYFEPKDVSKINSLVERIQKHFEVPIGRVWEKPVGPHPIGSCQITVSNEIFSTFIPWLMRERGDVDVFVHGNSGDDYMDHTQYTMWLGKSYKLNTDMFSPK